MKVTNPINIESARIVSRNFSGNETQFNRAGNRTFTVVIDNPEVAKALINDGWKLKQGKQLDDDEPVLFYLQVAVSYKNNPPKVVLVTDKSRKRRLLNEGSIGELDFADIVNVDLTINPYNWSVGANHGVKAYLKTMYVTIEEDPFAYKYEDTTTSNNPEDFVSF